MNIEWIRDRQAHDLEIDFLNELDEEENRGDIEKGDDNMGIPVPGEWVTLKNITDLRPGDMVRWKNNINIDRWKNNINIDTHFYVTASFGYHVTAVASVDISNPPEWEVWRERKEVNEQH